MKMDIDCIRDILLQAEDTAFTVYRDSYIEDDNDDETEATLKFPHIEKYDTEKLLYHIDLADEFGYLKVASFIAGSSVLDLSAQGHLFLADIRDDSTWNKVKDISKKIGVSSLAALTNIAVNVVSTSISNYFK